MTEVMIGLWMRLSRICMPLTECLVLRLKYLFWKKRFELKLNNKRKLDTKVAHMQQRIRSTNCPHATLILNQSGSAPPNYPAVNTAPHLANQQHVDCHLLTSVIQNKSQAHVPPSLEGTTVTLNQATAACHNLIPIPSTSVSSHLLQGSSSGCTSNSRNARTRVARRARQKRTHPPSTPVGICFSSGVNQDAIPAYVDIGDL